jgi:hypothetical protein
MMKATEEPMPTPKEKEFIYAEYEDNRTEILQPT